MQGFKGYNFFIKKKSFQNILENKNIFYPFSIWTLVKIKRGGGAMIWKETSKNAQDSNFSCRLQYKTSYLLILTVLR